MPVPVNATPPPPALLSSTHTAVVGLQWGDEGKGKIVDLLTEHHDAIVRYNGGANAGHTIVVAGERYALHLIPAGILNPDKLNIVGNGVVVDPVKMLEEKEGLGRRGIRVGSNLRVSSRAHVVLPWHKTLDEALENLLSGRSVARGGADESLGTTRRGIGPCYADKITRASAIRVGDLLDENRLAERMRSVTAIKNAQLRAFDPSFSTFDSDALTKQYAEIGRQIFTHVTDTTYLLHDLMKAGKRVLFEGANACLLDIDHGTFPFVTSSSTSALGIPAGTGVPCSNVSNVIGIMKAYTTRVGAGPFPTEQNNATGQYIRDRGREYGTTTGRPRRCGWLDLVAVKYSAMLCGATRLSIMLFDVLAGLETLQVCDAYEVKGKRTDRFMPDAIDLAEATPVYTTWPGFSEDVSRCRRLADLPTNARKYLDHIAEFVGVPIGIVSVGPDRAQTLID